MRRKGAILRRRLLELTILLTLVSVLYPPKEAPVKRGLIGRDSLLSLTTHIPIRGTVQAKKLSVCGLELDMTRREVEQILRERYGDVKAFENDFAFVYSSNGDVRFVALGELHRYQDESFEILRGVEYHRAERKLVSVVYGENLRAERISGQCLEADGVPLFEEVPLYDELELTLGSASSRGPIGVAMCEGVYGGYRYDQHQLTVSYSCFLDCYFELSRQQEWMELDDSDPFYDQIYYWEYRRPR